MGGFGFFERSEPLPLSVAWDAFGEDNGAPNLPTFDAQVRGYRRPDRGDRLSNYEIGCIMISRPVFFDDEHFVRRASDWQIQGAVIGGTFDAGVGEGRRVWEECCLQAEAEGWRLPSASADIAADAPRFGEPRLVAPRRGQKTFQLAVIAAYSRACAVSGEHSLPVLEAVHIRPYADDGSHETSNGLLLRSDIHRLFDRGLVTVTPDFQFKVSSRLLADYRNGRTYTWEGSVSPPILAISRIESCWTGTRASGSSHDQKQPHVVPGEHAEDRPAGRDRSSARQLR